MKSQFDRNSAQAILEKSGPNDELAWDVMVGGRIVNWVVRERDVEKHGLSQPTKTNEPPCSQYASTTQWFSEIPIKLANETLPQTTASGNFARPNPTD